MRRILVLLAMLGVLTGATVSSATAAPSDVKVTLAGKAQFVSPTTLQVPVTYVCPTSFVTAFVFVQVSQAESGATGSGSSGTAPCTGTSSTIVVNVVGGPWVLGPAVATGFVSAGAQFDQATRRIQIVL